MIQLKPHQTKAVADCQEKLDSHGLAILEGQQRTGKTLVALTVAQSCHKPVLFLTKKKAIEGVKSDMEKLGGCDGICVINYESAHKLDPMDWGLIILDECHSSGLSSFPKTGKVWRTVRALFKRTGARALLMSGTVSIESMAQLYHELAVTGKGPWAKWPSFYRWWFDGSHYKDGVGGGYGIQTATKRIGGGEVMTDYSQVDQDRIERDVSGLVVTVSRAQAGFKVTKASEKVVMAANEAILGLCDEIAKDGVVRLGDHLCVYETPAARLQGAHMACGGTLIDDQGEAFVLPDMYNPTYKFDLIRSRLKPDLQYVIFAHYIHERTALLKWFGDLATDDLETLRRGLAQVCILSTTSYSMGVDLSWLTGCTIAYSIPWSGAVWSQVLDRQLKWDRKREAIMGVVLLDGGVDCAVYDAVTSKQNFNARKYNPKTDHRLLGRDGGLCR